MPNQRAAIAMNRDEVYEFLRTGRTAIIATVSASGAPNLVAMWYAYFDECLWFETQAKSQKVVNLRRDPRLSCIVERGTTYDQLQGVSLEGTGTVVDDREMLFRVCSDVYERYTGPVTPESTPRIDAMLFNRVAIRFEIERIRSWDHRKLMLPLTDPAGWTARYL